MVRMNIRTTSGRFYTFYDRKQPNSLGNLIDSKFVSESRVKDLEAQDNPWRDQVENPRVHQITGERPIDRFKLQEAPVRKR